MTDFWVNTCDNFLCLYQSKETILSSRVAIKRPAITCLHVLLFSVAEQTWFLPPNPPQIALLCRLLHVHGEFLHLNDLFLFSRQCFNERLKVLYVTFRNTLWPLRELQSVSCSGQQRTSFIS